MYDYSFFSFWRIVCLKCLHSHDPELSYFHLEIVISFAGVIIINFIRQ